MNQNTNVTAAVFCTAIVGFLIAVLNRFALNAPLGDEIRLPAEMIAVGLGVYLLPAGFPRKAPPAAGALVLALALGGALPACATVADHNPVAAAETPEQVAFAVYGTFAATQELALEVVRSEDVPLELRRGVQRAEGLAKPAADALLVGAQAVLRARAAFDAGASPAEHVATALAELERLTREAQGPVAQLVSAVQAALGKRPSALLRERWPSPPNHHDQLVLETLADLEVRRGV